MIQVFDHDDDGYLDWLAKNPEGWVLNVRCRPDPSYVVLHRARCPTICRKGVAPGAWTARAYRKLCCTDVSQIRLAAMAEGRLDGSPSRACTICIRA